MNTKTIRVVSLMILALFLAGCAAAVDPVQDLAPPAPGQPGERALATEGSRPEATSPARPEPLTPVPGGEIPMNASPTPSEPIDPGLKPFIVLAVQDLARRLSIPEGEIQVLEARTVVWPDASMGCPRPGMVYIQVPQDGSLIRLQAIGQVFEYHSGGTREPFLCEFPQKSIEDPPPKLDGLDVAPGDEGQPGGSTG